MLLSNFHSPSSSLQLPAAHQTEMPVLGSLAHVFRQPFQVTFSVVTP